MSRFLSLVISLLIISTLLFATDGNAGLFDIQSKKKSDSAIGVGADAPDFSGENFLNNEPFNYNNDLKGKKVVLLDYWSIYCVSCLKEIPKLVEIYEKYKDKDIFFIGVDLDTSKRRLKKFLKDPKKVTPYPIVMDATRTIANSYNVNILPTTIIIDKDGKIQFYHEGYKPGDEHEIESVIEKLTN